MLSCGVPASVYAVVHEPEPGVRVRGVDVIWNLELLDGMARRHGVTPEQLHDVIVRMTFPDLAECWFVGRVSYWSSIAELHARRHWHA